MEDAVFKSLLFVFNRVAEEVGIDGLDPSTPPGARKEKVKDAYCRLVLKTHPDKVSDPALHALFRDVHNAFEAGKAGPFCPHTGFKHG